MEEQAPGRRSFLKTAGAAAFTTSIFTGNVKGANDRLTGAVIGIGMMGSGNLRFACERSDMEVVAICDVYQPHLQDGLAIAAKFNKKPKPVKDFREILADKSIDFVNISTPDHWHAYMTVEACKAGKDVYVEKPACTYIDEGRKMIEAARKYNRVVQAGTMQRSGDHFKKAVDIVKSGALGRITLCRTWMNGISGRDGIGNPPDGRPPADLDWNMWLGPAPERPFNPNRWGVHPELAPHKPFPYFRYFWDYAGGMMTDWGVHLLDIMHWAFDEPIPAATTALGGKWWVKDNRDTPDCLMVTYQYPQDFIATFETMNATSQAPYASRPGTLFCGTKGKLYVNRSLFRVTPEPGESLQEQEVESGNSSNRAHWANFADCIRSRQKPISDIETCVNTTIACQLANVSYRSGLRLDWDKEQGTVRQAEARKYLAYNYRSPWKLEV